MIAMAEVGLRYRELTFVLEPDAAELVDVLGDGSIPNLRSHIGCLEDAEGAGCTSQEALTLLLIKQFL